MSEQRLSKLQKWILENCFRVTVLLDRTTNEIPNGITRRKCRACAKTNESVLTGKAENGGITQRCAKDGYFCQYFDFYKEDILLSYFKLPPDNGKAHINRVQHFHDSPDYAKAHVTVHRSIESLSRKGLVYTLSVFREDSQEIHLTSNGLKKAAELLGMSDCTSLVES